MKNTKGQIDWEAVYHDQMPRIYNFFRYRVTDDALAEDLTAVTFEKAWKSRHRFRDDLSAFSTWLFVIARNTAADHFRRKHVEVTLDDNIPFGDQSRPVEDRIQQDDELAQLAVLMAQLSARERELLALKYGAGLTNRAIAEITDINESNVGTILYRVIHRLRATWGITANE